MRVHVMAVALGRSERTPDFATGCMCLHAAMCQVELGMDLVTKVHHHIVHRQGNLQIIQGLRRKPVRATCPVTSRCPVSRLMES